MTRHPRPPIGATPGTLVIRRDSSPSRISTFVYDGASCSEATDVPLGELAALRRSAKPTWIEVVGLGAEERLLAIGEAFALHPLALEAATNVPQRARHEPHADTLVSVARLPFRESTGGLSTPQFCLVLGDGWLLTFQDRYLGLFDAVRERLRDGSTPIRRFGADYLFTALLDAAADHYFPVIDELSARLEDLEDDILDDPGPDVLRAVHAARRELVAIRRIGQPQVDAHRSLEVQPHSLLGAESTLYLRSIEQHLAQGLGNAEAAREHASSLIELHISNVGQRTNDVMKVLTLMATIFIPLTFITGVYGMNFDWMPELGMRWGYPATLLGMAVVAVGMVLWFRRRGWLGDSDDAGPDA